MGKFEEAISFIGGSKRKKSILELLNESKLCQTEIMNKTGMYKSHTSRELKALSSKELIICINLSSREYKFYKITPFGKKVLNYLNNILSFHKTPKKA